MLNGNLHHGVFRPDALVGDAGFLLDGTGDAAGEGGADGGKEAPGERAGFGLVLQRHQALRGEGEEGGVVALAAVEGLQVCLYAGDELQGGDG